MLTTWLDLNNYYCIFSLFWKPQTKVFVDWKLLMLLHFVSWAWRRMIGAWLDSTSSGVQISIHAREFVPGRKPMASAWIATQCPHNVLQSMMSLKSFEHNFLRGQRLIMCNKYGIRYYLRMNLFTQKNGRSLIRTRGFISWKFTIVQ